MIRIYEVFNNYMRYPEYIYVSDEWFSSNFDSLQQLIDVGFDDTGKRASLRSVFKWIEKYPDIRYLCTVNSFDEIEPNFPEFFIWHDLSPKTCYRVLFPATIQNTITWPTNLQTKAVTSITHGFVSGTMTHSLSSLSLNFTTIFQNALFKEH